MNIGEVITDTVARCNIPEEMVRKLFLEAWNSKVDAALADGVVDTGELRILNEMLTVLGISKEEREESIGWKRLVDHILSAISSMIKAALESGEFAGLKEKVFGLGAAFSLHPEEVRAIAFSGWKHFVRQSLDDRIVSQEEERRLEEFAKLFEFSGSAMASYDKKILKGAILRDVFDGIVPRRIHLENQAPVLLRKNEVVIWVSNDVVVYEEKTRRQYTGGSSGVSVRIAKGVYLRSGSFKGTPVETRESVEIGCGSLIITNKNVFWVSMERSMKLPASKLVSVIPCSDAVILQKDGATAKPLTLMVDDPCFIANLIGNLNLLQ